MHPRSMSGGNATGPTRRTSERPARRLLARRAHSDSPRTRASTYNRRTHGTKHSPSPCWVSSACGVAGRQDLECARIRCRLLAERSAAPMRFSPAAPLRLCCRRSCPLATNPLPALSENDHLAEEVKARPLVTNAEHGLAIAESVYSEDLPASSPAWEVAISNASSLVRNVARAIPSSRAA